MSGKRKRYRKKPGLFVVAVRLDLETSGFAYRKWGGPQRCEPGDWIVNNNGDTYTVAHETFVATYEEVSPGAFEKRIVVWAEEAIAPGTIETVEGFTEYEAGDYLVHNREDGSDSYAVERRTFLKMYEPLP